MPGRMEIPSSGTSFVSAKPRVSALRLQARLLTFARANSCPQPPTTTYSEKIKAGVTSSTWHRSTCGHAQQASPYVCRANISESTQYEDRPDKELAMSRTMEHVEPPKRHAVLHDFCMVIPYGTVMVAAGLISLAFKSGTRGILIAAIGALQLLLAVKSLGNWRKGQASTICTAVAGAGSAALANLFYNNWRQGIARVPNLVLLAPSVALTLFLIYNIAAGGNPPKKAAP